MRFIRKLHYETAAMAEVRRLLICEGFNDESVDTFKRCLQTLENKYGFILEREEIISVNEKGEES